MNSRQKSIVLGALVIGLFMMLIPPWTSSGYEPIFCVTELANINWSRLLLQLAITVIVAAVAFISSNANQKISDEKVEKFALATLTGSLTIMLVVWTIFSFCRKDEQKKQAASIEKQLALEQRIEEKQSYEAMKAEEANRLSLLLPKKWDRIRNIVPLVDAYLESCWKEGKLYYRLHLVESDKARKGADTVAALEFAGASNHAYKLELYDKDKQACVSTVIWTNMFTKYKTKKGKVYALSTEQSSRPLSEARYQELNSWGIAFLHE